jgi:hypothetical protein
MQSWVCSAKSRAGSRMMADTDRPLFWRFFVDSYWFWSLRRPACSWGHFAIGTKPSLGNFNSENETANCAFRIATAGNRATPCKAGGNGAKAFPKDFPLTSKPQLPPSTSRSSQHLRGAAVARLGPNGLKFEKETTRDLV